MLRPVLQSAFAALAFLILLASNAAGAMPRREPPLLFGGPRAPVRAPAPVDPRLPTGALRVGAPRPESRSGVYCSFTRPLCVHEQAQGAAVALTTLGALETAYERLVLGMGLPEPKLDAGLAGSDALDIYLSDASADLSIEPDPQASGLFTQTSGFCEVPAWAPELLERAASLCVGELIALALDASESPHLRRAFATSLWWLGGLPTAVDAQALDDVQAHPELPIATRERSASSEGSALFFTYLETARSTAGPGELSAALLSAAVSPRSPSELHYVNEPDLFDVLRHSLQEDRARFAAMMVDFAVSRAFVGAREDGVHLPQLAWSGTFGKVRFDWRLAFSSLPRRVAIQPPIDSTGAVLIWLDLDDVPIGAALGVRAEWESPVSFQWQLVRVGARGEELGRVDIPFQERERSVEARVTNFDGAVAVLLVGTNLEGIEIAHPFDPDVAPFEPHGATLYLTQL
ncbi:MAG TPA: hypothetical protein VER33_27195 [Polyangiaceae bacterium]|nr:hypothetical protein [Polyangiaceae bacterium]